MGGDDGDYVRRVLNTHGTALKLYARQWCRAPDDAVQEALLKLIRQRRRPAEIAPWLFRVVRNEAISMARGESRRQRRETIVASDETWFCASEELLDGKTATEALGLLPLEIREIVIAKIWGELTLTQIAGITGLSVSTVHRRIESGLTQLRERLGVSWLRE